MPVYQLLGGKAREAIDTYGHASGNEIAECIDSAKKYVAQGFHLAGDGHGGTLITYRPPAGSAAEQLASAGH